MGLTVHSTLRHAVRRLLRARAFTIAAVLTLALGIGATTAVFTVVNAVLLQPLPYPRADRLVDLSHTLTISGITRVDQSDATFLYYARENKVFAGVGAYRVTGVNVAGLAGTPTSEAARSERLRAGLASASTFGVLRATPLLGRTFRDNEDRPDAPRVALIGQRLWERKFGADRSVLGRQLSIDGVPREIVGIMPADFDLPSSRADVWLPIGIDPAHTASAAFDYRGVGRLRDGVSLVAAAADLQRLLPLVPEAFPGRLTAKSIEQIRMRAVVRPLRDVVVGDIGRVLWVVLGAVACVMLIACANVTNLFLVRAEGRQHELAVRRALGAESWALAWDHVAEGAVLAVVGAMLGVGVAVAGVRVLRSLDGTIDIPRLAEVRVDVPVLAVVAVVTVLATLLVSVLPAIRAASSTALSALTELGRALTANRSRHRARHTLVVAQLALALVLLAGAGLMARSFARLRAVPSGIDAAHAFAFRVALPGVAYSDSGSAARFVVRALDAIGCGSRRRGGGRHLQAAARHGGASGFGVVRRGSAAHAGHDAEHSPVCVHEPGLLPCDGRPDSRGPDVRGARPGACAARASCSAAPWSRDTGRVSRRSESACGWRPWASGTRSLVSPATSAGRRSISRPTRSSTCRWS